MKKDEDKPKPYPDGYEHVEKKVKETQERVGQLDQQIKNVPQNSKPALELRPPGFTKPRYFGRERTIANLEQQKTELKTDVMKQVEQGVKDADQKTARQVRDLARESLFPNPFKRMDVEQKNKFHSRPKDIEMSQNYMDAMFSESKEEPKKEEKPEPKPMSMSTRFMQGLSYVRTNPTTNKSRDKDMDRE